MPGSGEGLVNRMYQSTSVANLPVGEACYVRMGRGKPVVFLHGAPLSLLTWRSNLAALSAHMDVIAIDLKGFGRSSKTGTSYTLSAQVNFLKALIDRLAVGRVSMVGSSYGCAVALSFASMHPELVDRLVLINSIGFPGGRHSMERLLRIGLLRKLVEPGLRSSIAGKAIFSSGLRRSYANPELATQEVTDAYLQLLRLGGGERTFLAALEQLDEAMLSKTIASIPHSTMVIWGAKDHVLPVKNANLFAKTMRHAEIKVLSECGHLPHEEDPESVNGFIRDFLCQPSSSRGAHA